MNSGYDFSDFLLGLPQLTSVQFGNNNYHFRGNSWDLFAQDDRNLSHGCIRLEDAARLGRWLMGRNPKADSKEPEQNELLPTPTPIYVTYLTAQVKDGQLSYVDDTYRRETPQVAAVTN